MVYLGIGSNLGDRFENIKSAIKKIAQLGEISQTSSLWETMPWGCAQQQPFLNCVISLETILSPFELLKRTSQIELKLGRKREQKFGPRTIDIDILLYGDLIINKPNLVIPHPYLHQRKFVLLPLSEIAPNLLHPILERRIKELLEDSNGSVEDCKPFIF